MAALLDITNNSKKPSKEIFKETFMPKDTLDQPYDVILVVEDGKQFKAHRQVLSEASPFFEKLLNSDMKESKEGIVRLGMFSESVMGNTLEFIYTGNVQILTEDSARDLIVIADYLFLQNVKTLASEVLLQWLNVSNCFSIYYFSERYQCDELLSKTKKFILANFSAIYAANRRDVLNLSSREIEMFISSDEINVSAEEEVFNIILSWIDHDKSKRKKYFVGLFRHVRLVYVSRDFQCKGIVTNDLVRDSEGCLDLVEDAMKLIESKDFSNLSVTPRKALEASVIVIESSENILCYFPCEDKWCSLGRSSPICNSHRVSCRGKLYGLSYSPHLACWGKTWSCPSSQRQLVRYNPFSNKWTLLPYTGNKCRNLLQIFVTNKDEMYALEVEPCEYPHGLSQRPANPRERVFLGEESYVFFITKYKPESNSWEDISSFDHLDRRSFCLVAKDDFIYFIGGVEYEHSIACNVLTDVDRYDLRKDQWNKVADIHDQGCRFYHLGAVVNGKIFISGQIEKDLSYQCQVYDETTNEWHIIANPNGIVHELLAVDGKLYIVCRDNAMDSFKHAKVECYDPGKDKWNLKTEITMPGSFTEICSVRIYKEFLADHQLESFIPGSLSEPSITRSVSPTSCGKCKCLIM